MDFEEREEIIILERTVREFMQQFPPEYWRKVDSERRFPEEYWRAAGSQGLLGITIPEEYGGAGLGLSEASTAMMAVAGSGGGLPAGDLLMRTLVFGGLTINRYGSKRVREELLPKLARGELICSFAHTEPTAGVNTFAIETKAVKKDGGYIVNGQKIWITLAHMADIIVAVVRTTPRERAVGKSSGLSLMLIDAKQEGVKTSRIPGMALRTLPSNVLYMEDVWVPEDQVLGEVDRGWDCLTQLLNAERISTASISLGVGDYALQKAVEHATTRVVFGKPIGGNQSIQFPLAEAKMELETARLMTRKAAWLYDVNRECAFEANVAAFQAARAAFKAADRAVQTLGGMGFAEEYDAERMFRDARLFRTAPVPEEMVLNYIATRILKLPRSF